MGGLRALVDMSTKNVSFLWIAPTTTSQNKMHKTSSKASSCQPISDNSNKISLGYVSHKADCYLIPEEPKDFIGGEEVIKKTLIGVKIVTFLINHY